MNFQRKIQV